ncbi:peptidase S41 [Chryseobacterium sp. RG1]|uniref:Peptidase S41 n=1 Tax=Chryseobacterium tagetis TaxID=2801334 RepID=A0ABS8A6D2_9FLAO|nr:S41 family peptidase [Chryseobacterium tagetis]MCA6069340.1 peptidase S41 [Chryseobacterium tagetis]
MKKIFITLLTMVISAVTHAQKNENLNLDFETNEIPANWYLLGNENYSVKIDQQNFKSGSHSIVIENKSESNNYRSIALTLPENYIGKEITLSAYIKTEKVSDGYAGMYLRIDPKVMFTDLGNQNITGTTDWKKYEIKALLNPQKTEKIVIGGILTGKGKMWFDDLKITIDGKDISEAKAYTSPYKADADKEFINGSKITNDILEKVGNENLYQIGLIWGYLKYYHPNIASGNHNWDYELFRILPKLENVTKEQRDKIIVNWITQFGDFKTIKYPKAKNLKMKADLNWIKTSGFSKELTELLLKIKTAERKNPNYYVSVSPEIGNPDFGNEKAYNNMSLQDSGLRMISLFRYWNIIQYYFPYRYAIGEDWKNVLKEFIPKFIQAENNSTYSMTCLELITRINDSHATLYNESINNYFGKRFPAVEVVFAENKAVIKSYIDEDLGKETGLKIGDVILEVNGKKVEEILEEQSKYFPASNRSIKLRSLSFLLLNSNNETVPIKFSSNGVEKETTLKTYTYKDFKYNQEVKPTFEMLNNDTAYLYLNNVNTETLPGIFEKIKNTKGLILDLRTYPVNRLESALGNYLMKKPKRYAKFSIINPLIPGNFILGTEKPNGTKNKNYYKGKVAILVNETSISRAEFHTMVFRKAPKAKVFGSQTAGADGDVSRITLPGQIQTMITGLGIYNPDGTETQRIGIVPDVEVKPTIEGIKNNKDEVLDKAVEWIKS